MFIYELKVRTFTCTWCMGILWWSQNAHTSCTCEGPYFQCPYIMYMWRSLLSMPIHHVHVKVLTFNAHTSCTCEGPYFQCPYIMYMWRSLISMSIHHVHVKVLTFHAHTSCNMWRSLLSMPIHHVHVKVLTFNAHTSCTWEGPYFQFIHAHILHRIW